MSGVVKMDPPVNGILDSLKDEKRMNVLYAPFRKKEMNPVDWESKMKFWHTAIEKWCLDNNRASFSVEKIQEEFKRNNRSPACIATAVEELIRCGQVKSKNEFLAIDPCQGWTSWAVDSFIKTPLTRSVSMLWNYWYSPDSSVSPDTEFIHISYLKKKGEKLFSETESTHEKVLTFEEISKTLSTETSPISSDTVHCIVHYLQLQGLVLVENVNGTKLVKLLRQGKSECRQITKADIAMFQLQQNISSLRKNVSVLEEEKESCTKEVKQFVAKGMTKSAKSALRKKHQLEMCIIKRLETLDNLRSLLDSLRNSESDSKVLDAYKTGLVALKGVFKSSGLTEDGVFNTMSEIKEVFEIQDEIETVMSQGIEKDVDEDDLELELADLVRMSRAGRKSTSVSINELPEPTDTIEDLSDNEFLDEISLPDAPTNHPSSEDRTLMMLRNLPETPTYTAEDLFRCEHALDVDTEDEESPKMTYKPKTAEKLPM